MQLLKFEPLLKQTLWGGDRIIPFKHLSDNLENVGESWEISGVKGNETVVAEGEFKGMRLDSLVAEQKDKLVGKAVYDKYGNEFPLLIKFIDARKDLSIQVHPNDETAVRQGKTRGKTEMWYALDSDADAKLYNGLKKQITSDQYKAMVENDTIVDALAQYDVKEGDVFFIPAGRIHAIGKGCFVAEIQQTSDVTYRIYDFKRKDKDGNYRELHTKEAAECIDYTVLDNYKTEYTLAKDERTTVVECDYFTTSLFDVDNGVELDYTNLDSFVILICVKGEGTIEDCNGESMSLQTGDTILVPATETRLKVTGNVRFLETH